MSPPPLRRKTSPWVWVLVGLLGLVLCVVLALGAGIWFVAKKAKSAGFDTAMMKKNPGLAAVKMMTALNPDMEMVSTDDERGIAVIRNKKEGKLYTINLEDAKNGKFVFQEEGKPATTISATTNGQSGQSGKVEITSSEGTATFGSGGKVPSWVPAYPGANAEGTFNASSNEGSMGNFTFKTSDSADKVISFYQDQLKSAGFKITTNVTDSDGKKAGMIAGEDADKKRSVAAIIGSDDSQTVVNLTVNEKK